MKCDQLRYQQKTLRPARVRSTEESFVFSAVDKGAFVARRGIQHGAQSREDENEQTQANARVPRRGAADSKATRPGVASLGVATQGLGDIAHDFRNGLAGVRGAVQIVRDALGSCPERDILGAALARLDRIDRQLRELLIEEAESARNRSGVRRIVLPPLRTHED